MAQTTAKSQDVVRVARERAVVPLMERVAAEYFAQYGNGNGEAAGGAGGAGDTLAVLDGLAAAVARVRKREADGNAPSNKKARQADGSEAGEAGEEAIGGGGGETKHAVVRLTLDVEEVPVLGGEHEPMDRRGSVPLGTPADLRASAFYAMDIGGTLAKLVIFEPVGNEPNEGVRKTVEWIKAKETYGSTGTRDVHLAITLPTTQGPWTKGDVLHFIKFDTARMGAALQMIVDNGLNAGDKAVRITGGGAYKFQDQLEATLGIQVDKRDELRCLLRGMNFCLRHVPLERFHLRDPSDIGSVTYDAAPVSFPYLVVNIGSGVSILRIDGENECERVSGSGLGGGTFTGLGRLMTDLRSFDEMLAAAVDGDSNNVDMLVEDIYGGAYENFGLDGKMVAACFAKNIDEKQSVAPGDITRALLQLLTNNLGQIAYLNAVRYGVRNIFFAGSFLRHNHIAVQQLARGVAFWSQGTVRASFFRHEGYFGALGAFLNAGDNAPA